MEEQKPVDWAAKVSLSLSPGLASAIQIASDTTPYISSHSNQDKSKIYHLDADEFVG